MFRKFTLATAAAATLAMVPATAQANHRSGYNDSRYEQSYRGDRYYGRSQRYYGNRNYNRRCSGTTGTVIGGVGGALLGRSVTRDRYRGRSGTTGTILGAAIGALAGRAVDKSSCRNRY